MLPQPQQQPNKPQKATQHKKQTHIKPPKNPHTQKNPQQQPNKNTENKNPQTQKSAPYSAKSNAALYQTEQVTQLIFSLNQAFRSSWMDQLRTNQYNIRTIHE